MTELTLYRFKVRDPIPSSPSSSNGYQAQTLKNLKCSSRDRQKSEKDYVLGS